VIIDRLRLLELLNELPDDELEQLPDAATRGWVEAELAFACLNTRRARLFGGQDLYSESTKISVLPSG
jgi:hypothetical protein